MKINANLSTTIPYSYNKKKKDSKIILSVKQGKRLKRLLNDIENVCDNTTKFNFLKYIESIKEITQEIRVLVYE